MMKKTLTLLTCSVIGNALGTALMTNTSLGLTAWGSAALNIGIFFNISFGTAFIIMAITFYVIAVLLAKRIKMLDALMSFGFLVAFGMLSDLFIWLIPDITGYSYTIRLLVNLLGLIVLVFSIALHLKILIAVHPCDVFLYQMQVKCKNDAMGTYLTFGLAFFLAIIFGYLSGEVSGIGIGTIFAVALSGLLIRFFNQRIIANVQIEKQRVK